MTTTRDVFNQIAPGWYHRRHWTIFRRELEEVARRWQRGRLLNVGCGHGADFLPFQGDFELYGADISPEMLKLASRYAEKHGFRVNLTEADARQLPYDDAFFDRAIAVATYHHIPGKAERLKALQELRRVLKPGGEAFLTVWNRWQSRFWFAGEEVRVPWRTRDKTIYRYYYLFSYGGLERLARAAGFTVLQSFPERAYHFPLKYFSRNICLLLQRPKLDGRADFN